MFAPQFTQAACYETDLARAQRGETYSKLATAAEKKAWSTHLPGYYLRGFRESTSVGLSYETRFCYGLKVTLLSSALAAAGITGLVLFGVTALAAKIGIVALSFFAPLVLSDAVSRTLQAAWRGHYTMYQPIFLKNPAPSSA